MTIEPHLRRARRGVFGAFFLTGFVLAIWLVNIPLVQERTGVSHGMLGGLLLLLGLGSFTAMQVLGWLIDRIGSRMGVLIGVVVLAGSISLPGLAGNAAGLGCALFAVGLGNGALDIAMNDQAVVVERRYGRPIMSAFHGFFSVGGAAGALAGAGMQLLGWNIHLVFGLTAVLAATIGAFSLVALLPKQACAPQEMNDDGDPTTAVATGHAVVAGPASGTGRRVFALAVLAFVLMLAEGVAGDWSALHAVEHLAQPAAAASLAYGAFAVFMTIGRFTADRISGRFGAVAVVRVGSGLAAAGLLTVIVSGSYPLTLAGWALFGIGLSGVVPQIFTAAGNLATSGQGVLLARVVSAGYLGLLAGPAVIGWMSAWTGLTLAFLLPCLFCLLGVALAANVRGRKVAKTPVPVTV